MDTQTVLGKHGAPFQIEWEDKIYTLSFRTQRIKAEVERWAKQRAVKDLVSYRNVFLADEYKDRMDQLLAKFDDPSDPSDTDANGVHQGGYAFSGARVQKLLATDDGAMALLKIVLGEQGSKLDEADIISLYSEKQDEINAFFRASQSKVQAIQDDLKGDDDPKALMRALKKADMW